MDEQDMSKEKSHVQNGPYILIPYMPQNGTDQQEALVSLYFRIKTEGLIPIVFHENSGITLLEFINTWSISRNLLQIFGIKDDAGSLMDICGMAWLSDITEISDNGKPILTKAIGSFLFLKKYQVPAFTNTFGDLIFRYWFETLGIDTLVGITPEPNRAASIYTKRQGMKELCRIPQYTTYEGKRCDGILSHLTKEEYRAAKGN